MTPAGMRGAKEKISFPRYICVIGPHAKAKEGTMRTAIKVMINSTVMTPLKNSAAA
jgi:hypothetical protein